MVTVDNTVQAINCNMSAYVVLLDLCMPFDSLDNHILLERSNQNCTAVVCYSYLSECYHGVIGVSMKLLFTVGLNLGPSLFWCMKQINCFSLLMTQLQELYSRCCSAENVCLNL